MPVELGPEETMLRWLDGNATRPLKPVPGRVTASDGRAKRDVGNRSIVAWPPARHDERNLDTTGNHHR
jgi:hypothetical protein